MKNKPVVASLMVALMLCLMAAGAANKQKEQGWRSLFDGKTLDGWEYRGGGQLPPTFDVEDGVIIGRTLIPRNDTGFVCTTEQFKDFELVFDCRVDPGLNSGVQVRSEPEGTVRGAQVEIESGSYKTGYIFGQGMGTWLSENQSRENKAYKEGQWNHFRVLVVGNTIKTWINDIPVADLSDDRILPAGIIGLQVHGFPRGNKREAGSDVVLAAAWKDIRIRVIE